MYVKNLTKTPQLGRGMGKSPAKNSKTLQKPYKNSMYVKNLTMYVNNLTKTRYP